MNKVFSIGLSTIFAACAATSLVACSKSSSNAAAVDAPPAAPSPAPAPAPEEQNSVLAQANAIGSWKSACFAHDKNSVIASLDFTEAGMTYSETIFHREDCEPGNEIVLYAYDYESPTADSGDLPDYQTVKFVVKAATVTLKNPSLVDIFNRDKNYKRTDWKLNKPNDITGRAHSKRSPVVRAVKDEVAYTFKITGDALSLADYQPQPKTKTYKAVASELPKHNFRRVN